MRRTLCEILDRLVAARGVAGVAVTIRPGARAETAWVPASTLEEPAGLVYSITKMFTATLVLLLRDEGRLTLDDSLARWFPGIAGSERISLRRLLNHTAGIPDYGGLASYHEAVRASPSTPWSFERFAAETFERGLCFPPGTGWAYSNPGYMLLRRIAEDVAGTSYARLVAERISRPLALDRTIVPDALAGLASLAPASSRALAPDGSPRDVRGHYHPGWVSHGVVASTPSEIARFLDALFGGRLVSPPSLAEMTALVPVPGSAVASPPASEPGHDWREPSYGLGLMADPASPWGLILGHNGGGPGYGASAFYAPELGGVSVCAIVAMEDGVQAEQLVFAVFNGLAARPGMPDVVAW